MYESFKKLLDKTKYIWLIKQEDVEHDIDECNGAKINGKRFSVSKTNVKPLISDLFNHFSENLNPSDIEAFIFGLKEEVIDELSRIDIGEIFNSPTVTEAKNTAKDNDSIETVYLEDIDNFFDISLEVNISEYRNLCIKLCIIFEFDYNGINELYWDVSQDEQLSPIDAVFAIIK